MPVDKDDFKIVTTYSEGLINLYQWNIDALTMEMVKSEA